MDERKVICEACGDVIETEPIPAGEDNHDRIIDGYEHGCVEDDDEQDRHADKTDLEANRERQADVAAAKARRSRGPRTPPPTPAGEYRIPHIPRVEHGPVSAPWTRE